MPSRFRLASQACFTYSGVPFTPRNSPFGPRTLPNLVASYDFVAAVFDRAPDQFFIFAGAVHIGRIKKRAAKFNGAMDGCDGFLLVARAIKL